MYILAIVYSAALMTSVAPQMVQPAESIDECKRMANFLNRKDPRLKEEGAKKDGARYTCLIEVPVDPV